MAPALRKHTTSELEPQFFAKNKNLHVLNPTGKEEHGPAKEVHRYWLLRYR